jgi:signal transduction histidine kinase
VEGDPHQLMQVFLNLVMNAEQAIREAATAALYASASEQVGESVWASFLDDGPGIPPDDPGQHLRSVLYDEAPGARDRGWGSASANRS